MQTDHKVIMIIPQMCQWVEKKRVSLTSPLTWQFENNAEHNV